MLKIFSLAVLFFSLNLFATTDSGHMMVKANELKWGAAPPTIPAGAQSVIVQGDPKAEGPFVLRLKLPAGYKIAPHTHPADENVTVLSGSFWMGSGGVFDQKKMMELPVGSFARMTTGTQHYAMTKKETIIQLHGVGPWGITYVNPKDDPRNQEK